MDTAKVLVASKRNIPRPPADGSVAAAGGETNGNISRENHATA